MPLHIENLSKTYANGTQAPRNITLTIPTTGLYGLIGPTGAGKSTLLRILARLQDPDEGSGSIRLDHLDFLNHKDNARQTIGYLSQDLSVYPKLSALELLDHVALLRGLIDDQARKDVIDQLLLKTDLWKMRMHRPGDDPNGMRRRFGLAVALLGNPRLLIVDEPTAGLDPTERAPFLDILGELAHDRAVVIATQTDSELPARTPMAFLEKGEIRQIVAPPSFTSGGPTLFPYPTHRSVPIMRA